MTTHEGLSTEFRDRVRLYALFMGIGLLTLGVAVYIVGRPAGTMQFPARYPVYPIATSGFVHTLLGALPTFLHATALALILGALAGGTLTRNLVVVWVWVAVELALEVAQRPAVAAWIVLHTATLPGSEPLHRYLSRGTFDVVDLTAAVLGGLVATVGMQRSESSARKAICASL